MSALGALKDNPSYSANNHETWNARERRASRQADRQGLCLRRACPRSGDQDNPRYNLVYVRYNVPVATDVELRTIEVWLGIPEAELQP